MKGPVLLLALALSAFSPAGHAYGQLASSRAPILTGLEARVEGETVQTRRRGAHPLLRTAAMLAASAGGFAAAQSHRDDGPDEPMVPIAAGAGAAALTGIIFSSAHPARIIIGSALSTLPAGAIAAFLAGKMEDDEQKQIPLIAFSIPHGLLSSAFAQNRR